jgi:hypothetical protein
VPFVDLVNANTRRRTRTRQVTTMSGRIKARVVYFAVVLGCTDSVRLVDEGNGELVIDGNRSPISVLGCSPRGGGVVGWRVRPASRTTRQDPMDGPVAADFIDEKSVGMVETVVGRQPSAVSTDSLERK